MARHFLDAAGVPRVDAIVVAGPAELPGDVARDKRLSANLRGLVAAVTPTSYPGRAGLREAVARTADDLAMAEAVAERDALRDVMRKLARESGLVAVGPREVRAAVEAGCAERVLFAPGDGPDEMKRAGADDGPLGEWLAARCVDFGVDLVLVSGGSAEAQQLRQGLGGVLALLRYEMPDGVLSDGDEDDGGDSFDDDDDFF